MKQIAYDNPLVPVDSAVSDRHGYMQPYRGPVDDSITCTRIGDLYVPQGCHIGALVTKQQCERATHYDSNGMPRSYIPPGRVLDAFL